MGRLYFNKALKTVLATMINIVVDYIICLTTLCQELFLENSAAKNLKTKILNLRERRENKETAIKKVI